MGAAGILLIAGAVIGAIAYSNVSETEQPLNTSKSSLSLVWMLPNAAIEKFVPPNTSAPEKLRELLLSGALVARGTPHYGVAGDKAILIPLAEWQSLKIAGQDFNSAASAQGPAHSYDNLEIAAVSDLAPSSAILVNEQQLREAQILINSAITPAETTMEALLNNTIKAIRDGQNNQLKAFSDSIRRGSMDVLQNQYGRLLRINRGFDHATDLQLQDMLGWYWNEYRLQRIFIKSAIEAGIPIAKTDEAKQWAADDKRFVEALRQFTARPENGRLRAAMENNGWNDNVAQALYEQIR